MNRFVANWDSESYRLIDFGDGRKLEDFHGVLLDRPCPAAMTASRDLDAPWAKAVRIRKEAGKHSGVKTQNWSLPVPSIRAELGLRLTPFGHVGVFPEQLPNWIWLSQQVQRCAKQAVGAVGADAGADAAEINCLNLFAYTGGSTLAMAASGKNTGATVRVAHVDAAQPNVKWASDNARLSGLSEAPIRWIVEDASKFVAREVRRNRRYQVIVLDPPTFGHGPSGRRWDMRVGLRGLVDDCCRLLDPSGGCLLLTGHSTEPSDQDCADLISAGLRQAGGEMATVETGRACLKSESSGLLDAGFVIRAVCRSAE